MATTNIGFSRNTPLGQELSRFLNDLARVHAAGPRLIAALQHMIDGNGSDAAHFAEFTANGFDSNSEAKAAWEELNSFVAKITTNASVTDVDAAWKQLLAKFTIV